MAALTSQSPDDGGLFPSEPPALYIFRDQEYRGRRRLGADKPAVFCDAQPHCELRK